MLRLTFELWLVFTSPDGSQNYSIMDEGMTIEDCLSLQQRLPMAPGYHLVCEPTP